MRIEAGRYRGRALPRPRGARPLTGRIRRSLFTALGPRLPGARVLDLFAGIGSLGLEALSRGARRVLLLERDARAVAALARWLREVGAGSEAEVRRRDVLRGPLPPGPFDLVFLDPPYAHWRRDDLGDLLARAVGVLDLEGLAVVRLPAREEVPEDPRFEVRRRRRIGTGAWVLLAPPAAPPGGEEAPDEGASSPSRGEEGGPIDG